MSSGTKDGDNKPDAEDRRNEIAHETEEMGD
jgi:hypothetical protein